MRFWTARIYNTRRFLEIYMFIISYIIFAAAFTPVSDTMDRKSNPVCFQIEPRHEISNNVVCATSKASDQPAHTHSLIRAFASHLSIL